MFNFLSFLALVAFCRLIPVCVQQQNMNPRQTEQNKWKAINYSRFFIFVIVVSFIFVWLRIYSCSNIFSSPAWLFAFAIFNSPVSSDYDLLISSLLVVANFQHILMPSNGHKLSSTRCGMTACIFLILIEKTVESTEHDQQKKTQQNNELLCKLSRVCLRAAAATSEGNESCPSRVIFNHDGWNLSRTRREVIN